MSYYEINDLEFTLFGLDTRNSVITETKSFVKSCI